MSALPPKADIGDTSAMSAKGQRRTLMASRSVDGTLVFDRNYVALQALLSSCIQFFGWFVAHADR
jgi:hypothetical protein